MTETFAVNKKHIFLKYNRPKLIQKQKIKERTTSTSELKNSSDSLLLEDILNNNFPDISWKGL